MAEEKILKDEILSDEQLDNVTGGTLAQTENDMNRFSAFTGMQFSGNDSQRREQFCEILFRCGVKIKEHDGFETNEYYLLNRKGEKMQALTEDQAMNIAINNYRAGIRIC